MAIEDKPQYLLRAQENIDILTKLKQDGQFLDWQITIVFYIGVHYINCYYCHHDEETSESHYDREKDMNPTRPENKHKIKCTSNAHYAYKDLYKLSRISRYNSIPIGDDAARLKQQNSNLVKAEAYLERVKTFIEGKGCALV